MAWAIGLEITLAILGLVNLDIPTLGTMIYWALNYQAILLGYWWWLMTPVVSQYSYLWLYTGSLLALVNILIPGPESNVLEGSKRHE